MSRYHTDAERDAAMAYTPDPNDPVRGEIAAESRAEERAWDRHHGHISAGEEQVRENTYETHLYGGAA